MKLLEVHAKAKARAKKNNNHVYEKPLKKKKLMKPPKFSRNHDTVHGTFKN